jgi:prepilin-type N-terminal cleavage/methylation domain-containing protein
MPKVIHSPLPETRPRAARFPPSQPSPGDRGLGEECGFTLIEVLIATLVLVIGLLGLFATLDVATHTTMRNRQRQAETSLSREVIEDASTLAYGQLTQATLVADLQPMVAGSTISGQGLVVSRSIYNFNVSWNVCSLDDPTDGYGNHSSAPSSGGSWCPDVAGNGTADTNPDDQKRLSVTVTPRVGTEPTVQLTTLIHSQTINGPAVSCVTTTSGVCPGTNQTITSSGTSTLTFYVTTKSQAASVQWLVNGNQPPSAQIATGTDPYVPSSTSSQFTWKLPQADGTYTISVYAQDSNGATGSRSSLQVTLNSHQAAAPGTLVAGYDWQIGGVDVQWVPSTDQDILYYNVYHKVGNGASTVACSQVNGTSCTDMTSSLSGSAPSACTTPLSDLSNQSNVYWVVGVDTDPATGQPRESALTSSTSDANLCDVQPSTPTHLTASAANGAVTLNWTAPTPLGAIQGWRIYRWASGSNVAFPGSRLSYVGTSSGSPVTSFTDSSPDPGGTIQNYCVTAVDTHLNESTCSNAATG